VKIAAKKMNERLNVSNSHGVVLFVDIERSVPAASEFIGKQFQTKSRNQIYNRANMLNVQWPNHSLNLTEPTVDKFAARQATSQEHQADTSAQRSTWNWPHVAAG
jgi:hypothetical protein